MGDDIEHETVHYSNKEDVVFNMSYVFERGHNYLITGCILLLWSKG